MRYRLRTLLIVLTLGPMVLAGGWREYRWWQAQQDLEARLSEIKTNWASMGFLPPEMWQPDLTLERTPIIQVDLGAQDKPDSK